MRLRVLASSLFLAAASVCQAADVWKEPETGMEFVAIPKGCYKMGLPAKAFEDEAGEVLLDRMKAEKPQHEVCLDKFWLGKYEVTVAEWRHVMGGEVPVAGGDRPIAGITWTEADSFARRLTEKSGGKSRFRLPTEAEWEYACRAGTAAISQLPTFADLDEKAWYNSPLPGFASRRIMKMQPVGKKQANPFGLHDMLGNAWEWVQDAYSLDAYARHPLYNPVLTEAPGNKHVIRGGGVRTDRRLTRCETRGWVNSGETLDTVGFRLVRMP